MLTFESIRDIERAEKENKKLQRLPSQFFDDLQEYLKRKRADAFANADEMIEYQNIMNIVERLFEMREQKIVEQALDAARIGINPENLHENERNMFEQLSGALSMYRKQFFSSLKSMPQDSDETTARNETSVASATLDASTVNTQTQKLFRVKKEVPEFIGPDMKTYKLKENDVITLPAPVAKILMQNGAIEEMS